MGWTKVELDKDSWKILDSLVRIKVLSWLLTESDGIILLQWE